MTLQELIELAKSFGGRYAKRRVNPNNAEEVKSPKRRRLSPTKQVRLRRAIYNSHYLIYAVVKVLLG